MSHPSPPKNPHATSTKPSRLPGRGSPYFGPLAIVGGTIAVLAYYSIGKVETQKNVEKAWSSAGVHDSHIPAYGTTGRGDSHGDKAPVQVKGNQGGYVGYDKKRYQNESTPPGSVGGLSDWSKK